MLRSIFSLFFSAAVIACSLSGCTLLTTTTIVPPSNSLAPDMVSRIENLVRQKMQENKVPGLALGIIKNNEVAYTQGFGVADITTGRQVTPQTIFQMGSDAKMMVGISVMQLVNQGQLDLEQPVSTYL
ncbi:MAG TPA: serine hydrolase domain-containing protein, partial [Pseudomonadales bacterium]|nr:serine hydrolase domain-containing protein [Pseudomonadales bacterium]